MKSRLLFIAISSILVASSMMKLWSIATDPFADVHSGYPIGLLAVASFLELLVACALCWHNSFAVKWVLLVTTFSVFLLISSIRFTLGFQGCGCFGRLFIPQWTSVVISVVVLLLAVALLPFKGLSIRETGKSGGNQIAALVRSYSMEIIGISFASIVFVALTYLPVKQRLISVFGEQLVVAKPVWIEDMSVGKSSLAKVLLLNRHSSPISVVGFKKSCGCIALEERRITIPPGAEEEFSFKVIPATPGRFHHRLIYFLNSQHQQRVDVDILGFSKGT